MINDKRNKEESLEDVIQTLNSSSRFGLALDLLNENTQESKSLAASIMVKYYEGLKVYDDEGNPMDGHELPLVQKAIYELERGMKEHQQIEGPAMDRIKKSGMTYRMLIEKAPLEALIEHFKHNGLSIDEKYSIFDYKNKSLEQLGELSKESKDDKVKIALQEANLLYMKNKAYLNVKYGGSAIDGQIQLLEDAYKNMQERKSKE